MKPVCSLQQNIPDLGWHVEHQRNHWGVFIPIDDEAHLFQTPPEIPGVFSQLLDTLFAWKIMRRKTQIILREKEWKKAIYL